MPKIVADNLENAYKKASKELNVSIAQIDFEIIQYPRAGFLGFFSKEAIVYATVKSELLFQLISTKNPKNLPNTKKEECFEKVNKQAKSIFLSSKKSQEAILKEIEQEAKAVFDNTIYRLILKKVEFLDKKTVFFTFDGDDAALVIGKDGYRYNAFLELLKVWLTSKYNFNVCLEVAQFLQNQTKMVVHLLSKNVEEVKKKGSTKTDYLNGVLLDLGEAYLKKQFQDKIVSVKTNNNQSYILVFSK